MISTFKSPVGQTRPPAQLKHIMLMPLSQIRKVLDLQDTEGKTRTPNVLAFATHFSPIWENTRPFRCRVPMCKGDLIITTSSPNVGMHNEMMGKSIICIGISSCERFVA